MTALATRYGSVLRRALFPGGKISCEFLANSQLDVNNIPDNIVSNILNPERHEVIRL